MKAQTIIGKLNNTGDEEYHVAEYKAGIFGIFENPCTENEKIFADGFESFEHAQTWYDKEVEHNRDLKKLNDAIFENVEDCMEKTALTVSENIIRVPVELTEDSSHLDIDAVEIEVTPELVQKIIENLPALGSYSTISASANWLYKSELTDVKLDGTELAINDRGGMYIKTSSKYCGSNVESDWCIVDEVEKLVEIRKKHSVVKLDVLIKSMNDFNAQERGLLVFQADLLSQSDLENKIILYHDSLQKVLDNIDEDKLDVPFLHDYIETALVLNLDQYIFD